MDLVADRRKHARPAGPPRADFDTLYQQHSREVWALAYARWMNADTALDVAAGSFFAAVEETRRRRGDHQPAGLAAARGRNLAEDLAKSSFRRNGTHPPQLMNGVQSREASPLELLEREESFAQLRVLLHQMPQADREILTLRYALDYNTGQIADLLGINATAVHMRLSRARQRLADRLKAQGVEETS